MRVLLALALMASPVLAQDTRGTDFMVQRLKERLKLSDDQAAKVKEILAKDSEDRTKMDEARTEKINALLDADQKKAYEEMRSNQRGFGGGRQFQFGGGAGGARPGGPMGSVNVDDVKRELGLSDEQVEKIKPLYDEFNASLQKRQDELREKGFQGLNFGEEMQKYQDNLKGLAEKVKTHLTDEQKTKLDGMVERVTGMMRFLPGLMNQGARGGGAAAPRPSAEERTKAVVAALKVEKDDERSVIADLVLKIVKAQYELEDFTKSSRDKLNEASKNRELSDAAVEDRIKEAQEDRRKREKEIAALQKQLAEVTTNRQELELMAQGILK
jgi:hypothetical protein